MVVANWVVGASWGNEVTWDDLGALVDQLIEGVLTVGAWLTPNDWASLVGHRVAVAIDALTVGLHVALLEVSWEAVHVLVVR